MSLLQYLQDHPDAEPRTVQGLLGISPADYLWALACVYPVKCLWRLNVGRKKMGQVLETYKQHQSLNDTALKHRDVSRKDIRSMIAQAGMLCPQSRKPPPDVCQRLHERIRELAAAGYSRSRIRIELRCAARTIRAVLDKPEEG